MKRRIHAVLVLIFSMVLPAPAFAGVVNDWNEVIADAVTIGRPSPIGLLDVALAHAAVHDAVQAIEGRFHLLQPHAG